MPSSPFLLSLASLKRQEGSRIEWENTVAISETIGREDIHVPAGSALDVSVSATSVNEGVYVQGSISAPLAGQCSRCLRSIDENATYPIAELVYYPERRAILIDEGDEDAQEAPVISDDYIDLDPLIRDAIVLALPFQPLCREDCEGLCPECGEAWDDLPSDHEHEAPYNPQFDALARLEAQLQEGE